MTSICVSRVIGKGSFITRAKSTHTCTQNGKHWQNKTTSASCEFVLMMTSYLYRKRETKGRLQIKEAWNNKRNTKDMTMPLFHFLAGYQFHLQGWITRSDDNTCLAAWRGPWSNEYLRNLGFSGHPLPTAFPFRLLRLFIFFRLLSFFSFFYHWTRSTLSTIVKSWIYLSNALFCMLV